MTTPFCPLPARSVLALAVSAALLAACGGGGGGSSASGGGGGATTLSGTVAVGAPISSATITIKGANGATVSATAGDDGRFSGVDLSGLTAPYRIEACGLVDGAQSCYYAMAGAAGVANVTPLSHAALALAHGGDPADAFASNSPPSLSSVTSRMDTLRDALAPVLTAAGLSASVDLATLDFDADHTGLDKVLDAVKVSTGQSGGHAMVQMEGRIGAGNFLIDDSSSQGSGTLTGSNLSVDLSGIGTVFDALSTAVGQATISACASTMTSAAILDSNFKLLMGDDNGGVAVLTASNMPTTICTLASDGGLLGGHVAHPVLHDCDFSGNDKYCTVGFDIVHAGVVLDAAELAVVHRQGSTGWQLVGQPSSYQIHVNASVQRTVRVNASASPQYYRAISFDILASDGSSAHAVRAAKVYLRDASGTGWESAPVATLSDSGCSTEVRLTITGSSCGSTWMGLDNNGNGFGNLADGDAVIDAFFQRGRVVRIDLYSDTAGTTLLSSETRRIAGVPPKSADLASVPWLELDASVKTALQAYDSGSSATSMTVSWASNKIVAAKDVSVCGDSSCSPRAHASFTSAEVQARSTSLSLSSLTLTASGFKEVSLYGRDRDGLGVSANYVSCSNSDSNCPQ